MDPLDRLAAYAAGELDERERTLLDAELARDPDLRSQLDALRRADEALAGLETPEPPAGFDQRLDAAVTEALGEILSGEDADHAATEDRGIVDELAERRARRTPRWVTGLAGAAATIAVLAGVATLAGIGRGADSGAESAMSDEAASGEMELFTQQAPGAATDGPVLLAAGRDLDDEAVDALLSDGEVAAVAQRSLGVDEGDALAQRFAAAFGLDADRSAAGSEPAEDGPVMEEEEAAEPESDAGGDDAGDGAESLDAPADLDDAAPPRAESVQPSAPPPAGLRTPQGQPDEATVEAATRCLATLLDDADTEPIPVYLEVADYQGRPAIVAGLVTLDPGTGRYTRSETWVMDRADCRVLRFSQG